jgi:pyridoxal phosphate enzyme (YggS family)
MLINYIHPLSMNFNIISNKYFEVKQDIEAVCKRVNRDVNEITLVAVSKTFPKEDITDLYKLGHKDFGENKVQELKAKYDSIASEIRDNIKWHLVGHLQSNKVKYIAGFIHLIHSVDSLNLAEEIQKQAEKFNRIVDILVQVNTSGEQQKSGIGPEGAKNLCKQIRNFQNIRLRGLMTIGKLTGDKKIIRENFRELYDLYNDLKPSQPDFKYLSMGMTSDFKIALEEGSNMLRIGSAIFGERIYGKAVPSV